MNKLEILPIEYEIGEVYNEFCVELYNVTFLEDFGVFKKGERYDCININYEEGVVEEYTEDAFKSQVFVCKPI